MSFDIASEHLKQATITVDLKPYVQAYATNRKKYQKIRSDFEDKLSALSGDIHWINLLEAAVQNLPPEQREKIKNSRAVEILEFSFVEILKNSMDEALDGFYEDNLPAHTTITLEIDDESDPDNIMVTVTDTGRGFDKEKFLDKVTTPEARQKFIEEHRGSKKRDKTENEEEQDRAEPFGGRGRGLRILAAEAENITLENSGIHSQNRSANTSPLIFENKLDEAGRIKGASITVISPSTSRAPSPEDIVEDTTERSRELKQDLHTIINPGELTLDTDSFNTDEYSNEEPSDDEFEDDDLDSPGGSPQRGS